MLSGVCCKCLNLLMQIAIMKLQIPKISFDMPITDLIMELEKLRYKDLSGMTNPLIFNQIRQIFHMLESVGSSRIEGNNTTIMDYVENTKIETGRQAWHEQIKEIRNIEVAMAYIEENINDMPISSMFIRELHQLTVNDLSYKKEGAAHPGQFRQHNVRISGSAHTPPDYTQVDNMMQELIDFINQETAPKYDLLKIAIAHHRFVWIHPFENGNGRVVRLFTYAMLLKSVFKSRERIINPTAVFCNNRNEYYDYLSKADEGTDCGMLQWAEYMLRGLKQEIEKIDKLSDAQTLREKILLPALDDALNRKFITPEYFAILQVAVKSPNSTIQSSDLTKVLPGKSSSDRSRAIKSLVDAHMLAQIKPNARKYYPVFSNNYLLRSILWALDKEGFLPVNSGIDAVEDTVKKL